VLAHQIVGLTLVDEGSVESDKVYNLVIRAYPFREYTKKEHEELTEFLRQIGLLKKEGNILKKTGKGRRYYYENLGMINDERRYPFINAITDEMIGTVGDEFWSLRARVGLNVILRGRVWRILQIDEKRGVIHALPSTDPRSTRPGRAIPGSAPMARPPAAPAADAAPRGSSAAASPAPRPRRPGCRLSGRYAADAGRGGCRWQNR